MLHRTSAVAQTIQGHGKDASSKVFPRFGTMPTSRTPTALTWVHMAMMLQTVGVMYTGPLWWSGEPGPTLQRLLQNEPRGPWWHGLRGDFLLRLGRGRQIDDATLRRYPLLV